jgi:hypothetical protein
MKNKVIYSKIQMLHSDDLKKDLLQYLEFVLKKQTQSSKKRHLYLVLQKVLLKCLKILMNLWMILLIICPNELHP